VPSTDPMVSAGEVDPESATEVSLDAETGSPAVDVVGSVTVASPDEAEASTGVEAASPEEGVASVEGVASAEDVSSVVVFDGADSATTAVLGSVDEVVVSVAASEVSCVVVLAASTVVSALTGVATGSMSTVGSLKVYSPLSPQTFLHTLVVKVQPPSIWCFPLFEGGESKLSPDFFLGNFPRYLPQRV
jgi:hypothetical protein